MDNETGIKYVGFFSFKKRIDGVLRECVRMVGWNDTLEEAKDNILSKPFLTGTKDDYYIAIYDVTGSEMKKLGVHFV